MFGSRQRNGTGHVMINNIFHFFDIKISFNISGKVIENQLDATITIY
jgi:hypothetical protein